MPSDGHVTSSKSGVKMDNQADQQSPEVELEEHSSEQTPDDAGQHSDDEGEQSQNTEQQQESEDDDEEEFYFGDECWGRLPAKKEQIMALLSICEGRLKRKSAS